MQPVILPPPPISMDHIALPPVHLAGEGPVPASGFTEQLREATKTQATPEPIEQTPRVSGDNADPSGAFAGAFARLDESLRQLQNVQDRQRSLHDRIDRGELDSASPEARRAERQITTELMNLQIMVQRANFGVELVSKVVEHGANGMRTVLQTQA